MVPLVAVAVDKSTVKVKVAVAVAGGVEAVDAGPKTTILASSYLMIPFPPLPLRCTALVPRSILLRLRVSPP